MSPQFTLECMYTLSCAIFFTCTTLKSNQNKPRKREADRKGIVLGSNMSSVHLKLVIPFIASTERKKSRITLKSDCSNWVVLFNYNLRDCDGDCDSNIYIAAS